MTGITDLALQRASHIIPWADCQSDAERLDPSNGLLLSSLWDSAFDAGLVTFEDNGSPRLSRRLSPAARTALTTDRKVLLTEGRRARLAYHRARLFAKTDR